ncbi:unnamed protein product [marine sediment metagenome]|uniref:Uncharacterized protein n=1 Tax=marine sediment metagenome TaxID=412755 RepID=X1JSX9_9ZZZZ
MVFDVAARGIGRKDYSQGTEISVEPLITSWQGLYTHTELVAPIPAGGSITTDVAVPTDQVVILHDVYATVPQNTLIRLILQSIDLEGDIMTDLDMSDYQSIDYHYPRGDTFWRTIRFITYNYRDVVEDLCIIGCAGFYTSHQSYNLQLG